MVALLVACSLRLLVGVCLVRGHGCDGGRGRSNPVQCGGARQCSKALYSNGTKRAMTGIKARRAQENPRSA